jgi:hypothetical protein
MSMSTRLKSGCMSRWMFVPTSVFYQMTLHNDTAYDKILREEILCEGELFDLLT